MKPIITPTFSVLPVSSSSADSKRTSEDEARLRRDAERVRQRRLQIEHRQQAEAEGRLADAMARASAKSAPLSRAAQQATDTAAALWTLPLAETTEIGEAALAENAQSRTEEAQAALAASLRREQLAESPDPVRSLLQRLARGQSRGLLQDCAPLLEAIRARLVDRALAGLGDESERESLASALDFLQGYAEAATARVQGADKIASLLIEVRQQFEALHPEMAPASAVAAAVANQQLDSRSPGSVQTNSHARRTSTERNHVHAARRIRPEHGADVEDEDGEPLTASAMAVAAGMGAERGKVAAVPESSLDKDQRKRRDDTLPLVTLRSI